MYDIFVCRVCAGVEAQVSLHVARVWLTHSSALLRELRSCLTEFKQYLANLARSIRAAAADMALGLVHPRYAASRDPHPVCTPRPHRRRIRHITP